MQGFGPSEMHPLIRKALCGGLCTLPWDSRFWFSDSRGGESAGIQTRTWEQAVGVVGSRSPGRGDDGCVLVPVSLWGLVLGS